jgi:hypothetical protein
LATRLAHRSLVIWALSAAIVACATGTLRIAHLTLCHAQLIGATIVTLAVRISGSAKITETTSYRDLRTPDYRARLTHLAPTPTPTPTPRVRRTAQVKLTHFGRAVDSNQTPNHQTL